MSYRSRILLAHLLTGHLVKVSDSHASEPCPWCWHRAGKVLALCQQVFSPLLDGVLVIELEVIHNELRALGVAIREVEPDAVDQRPVWHAKVLEWNQY